MQEQKDHHVITMKNSYINNKVEIKNKLPDRKTISQNIQTSCEIESKGKCDNSLAKLLLALHKRTKISINRYK